MFCALALLATTLPPGRISPSDPNVYIPDVSVAKPEDLGRRAHTDYMIYVGPPWRADDGLPHGPFSPGPPGFHPSDIRSAYNDNGSGSGIVAIVDAYDNPYVLTEFNTFSGEFGLPSEPSSNPTLPSNKVFQVLFASGTRPAYDANWALEMSLDTQWAHAMAPGAKILLVEAASNDLLDLLDAVEKAIAAGAKFVSMSWAANEFVQETAFDIYFARQDAKFFAASGDAGGLPVWPSASPFVMSCGGTTLIMSNGQWESESTWPGTGGGPSVYERRPSYQNGISMVGTQRGTPDFAADGDVNTGVSVYTIPFGGWGVLGGTSLSCPLLCGMSDVAVNSPRDSEFTWIYTHGNLFHDIVTGMNGPYSAGPGYDFGTGMGTPITANSL